MKKRIILAANTDWYIFNFRKKLITALVEGGWKVYIVTPPGKHVEDLLDLGITHLPWEVGRQTINPVGEWKSIRKLREIYLQLKPTIIHQHTLKSVIYGNIAARNTDLPIINSIAGRGYIYSSSEIQAQLVKPILDLLLRFSMSYPRQEVIFENSIDRQYFLDKKFIRPNNGHLIQSVGVDIDFYKPEPIPKLEHFTVGYVGRMLWNKGVGVFADAARQIKNRGKKCRLVLIGLPDPGNPESVSAKQIMDWVEEGILEWWGWQTNMAEVYRKIHALAFPTNYGEGVPTVLLEAGASQRALLASDAPGCREVITDGEDGFLIPINDPAALADRIVYLSENENEYNRIRKNARKKIIEQFSKKTVIARTLEVYRSLLQDTDW